MTDPSGTDEGEALRALLTSIDEHPGTVAQKAWESLRLVHAAFLGNQAEFLAMIDAIETNRDDIGWTMTSNMPQFAEQSHALYAELFRRLHNYVSSAVTLVDHTRNLIKGYEGTDTHAEYLDRITAIRADGLGPFVAKLRVFVVHVGVPAIGTKVSIQSGVGQTITSYIDRDSALRWPDWPSDARRFLADQPEHVPFREVITAYGDVVDELYRWFYDQFPTLHGADIEAVNELIARTPWAGRPDLQQ